MQLCGWETCHDSHRLVPRRASWCWLGSCTLVQTNRVGLAAWLGGSKLGRLRCERPTMGRGRNHGPKMHFQDGGGAPNHSVLPLKTLPSTNCRPRIGRRKRGDKVDGKAKNSGGGCRLTLYVYGPGRFEASDGRCARRGSPPTSPGRYNPWRSGSEER